MCTRTIVAGVLGFLAVLVVGFFVVMQTDVRKEPPLQDVERRHANERPEFAWSTGEEDLYDLVLESEALMDLQGTGEPMHSRVELEGRLAMRVRGHGHEGIEVEFEFVEARLVLDGRRHDDLNDALMRAFEVTFDPDGRVLFVLLPERIRDGARQLLGEVVRTFQVILPRSGAGPAWITEEEDATGLYRASYRPGAHPGEVVKEKIEYLATKASGNDALFPDAETRIRRSSGKFHIEPGRSWIRRADIEEELIVRSSRGQSIVTRTRGTLSSIGVRPSRAPRLIDPDRCPESPVAALDHVDPPPEKAVAGSVDQLARLEDALMRLSSAGGLDLAGSKEILALLRARPELALRFPEILSDPGLDARVGSLLVHLLGRAETPQAETALNIMLSEDRIATTVRMQSAVALGGSSRPSDGAIEGLWIASGPAVAGDHPDVANCATLALGCAAESLRAFDMGRYDRFKARIANELSLETSTERRAALVRALGNTRDPSFSPTLRNHLSEDLPAGRMAAASALGALGDDASRTALADALENEAHPMVRTEIIRKLATFDSLDRETISRLLRLVDTERDETARTAMASCLGRNVDRDPGARAKLIELLRRDTSARVRRMAAVALARD